MKEYKIRITGEYDLIVLSPKTLSALIERIQKSGTRELVVPADELLPPGYASYLSRFLKANREAVKALPDQDAYRLVARQIEGMRFEETYLEGTQREEKECFDCARVVEPGSSPKLDLRASRDFFIVVKKEESRFLYTMPEEGGEEIRIRLKYL